MLLLLLLLPFLLDNPSPIHQRSRHPHDHDDGDDGDDNDTAEAEPVFIFHRDPTFLCCNVLNAARPLYRQVLTWYAIRVNIREGCFATARKARLSLKS